MFSLVISDLFFLYLLQVRGKIKRSRFGNKTVRADFIFTGRQTLIFNRKLKKNAKIARLEKMQTV